MFFETIGVVPTRKPQYCRYRTQLGLNVAALRAQQDLTQEKLAEKTGVSARYIQSVEAGEYFPTLPKLVRLRTVLRCDWKDFFAGCDEM